MQKNIIVKWLIGYVLVLFVTYLLVPYKNEALCVDYKCTVKKYYSLYSENYNVNINEDDLKLHHHTGSSKGLSSYTISPLNIEYHNVTNAKRDKNIIADGNGHITKYSLFELIEMSILMCLIFYVIYIRTR